MTVIVNTEKGWTNYATIWHVSAEEKYADVRFSTSEQVEVYEKNEKTGKSEKTGEKKWKNSNWMGRFYGSAFDKVKDLGKNDKVILTKFKIENVYDKEKDKNYVNFTVTDVDIPEKKSDGSYAKISVKKEDEEPLPW